MSAGTGMQPISGTGMTPPGSVMGGTMISVKGSGSSARKAVHTADVPEFTASAKPPPR